jgi:hypothetical protein
VVDVCGLGKNFCVIFKLEEVSVECEGENCSLSVKAGRWASSHSTGADL